MIQSRCGHKRADDRIFHLWRYYFIRSALYILLGGFLGAHNKWWWVWFEASEHNKRRRWGRGCLLAAPWSGPSQREPGTGPPTTYDIWSWHIWTSLLSASEKCAARCLESTGWTKQNVLIYSQEENQSSLWSSVMTTYGMHITSLLFLKRSLELFFPFLLWCWRCKPLKVLMRGSAQVTGSLWRLRSSFWVSVTLGPGASSLMGRFGGMCFCTYEGAGWKLLLIFLTVLWS